MKLSSSLKEIEIRVMATLHEAGEENVSALLNSVLRCCGRREEPLSFVSALRKLFQLSLIGFAEGRDKKTLQWTLLSDSESHNRFERLPDFLCWSETAKLWKWLPEKPMLVVVLTTAGQTVATKILSKHGWRLAERKQ